MTFESRRPVVKKIGLKRRGLKNTKLIKKDRRLERAVGQVESRLRMFGSLLLFSHFNQLSIFKAAPF
jgi:hypothetical protein